MNTTKTKTTNAMTFLYAEEAARILTLSAIFNYLINEESESEAPIKMLRDSVEIVATHAECPELREVFIEALEAEKDMQEVYPASSTDEVDDAIRRRQAWRAEKYLTALAKEKSESGDTQQAKTLLEAARYLRDFWELDDPISSWYNVATLMRA